MSRTRRIAWTGFAVMAAALWATTGCGNDVDEVEDEDDDGFDELEDCNDIDPDVYPGADELCDLIDNDCDGDVDEDDAVDATTWYADDDGDGFGDDASTSTACSQPAGHVDVGGDCDDGEAGVNPDADEVCDGVDNDCDTVEDEDDAVDATTWYEDGDGDGYGDDASMSVACDQPAGFVDVGGDCDDASDAAHPGGTEVCDGEDNDCDGTTDGEDATDATTWYLDDDGDGYGVDETTQVDCTQPVGYAADGGDCDDTLDTVNPGADEICDNGEDENCDTIPDDGCPIRHCGDIAADETWDASVPHLVTCDIHIQGPSPYPVLTIADGALVMFERDTMLYTGYTGYGSLVVEGSTLGVTMTSADPTPAAGDWDGITFGFYDDGSRIEGATIEYAGGDGLGAIYAYYSSPEIAGTTVADSGSEGLFGQNATPWIHDSTFRDSTDEGISLDAGSGLSRTGVTSFTNNTVTGSGSYAMVLPANFAGEIDATSSFTGNAVDVVRLLADDVSEDATWQDLDVDWNVAGTVYVQGPSPYPVLTIADGASFVFDRDALIYTGYTGYGSLVVDGHTLGVTMTSADPTPAAGDWDGLTIGFYDDGSRIDGATIDYAGGDGNGAIYLYYSSPEITNATVRDSGSEGLFAQSSHPLVQGSTFSGNADAGVYLDAASGLDHSGTASFTGNTLTGNGSYAMVLPANYAGEIDATSSFTGNSIDVVRLLDDDVAADATWQAIDVPWNVAGTVYIQGPSPYPVVTIADGSTFLFDDGALLYTGYTGYGSLVVDGSTLGVTFTSARTTPAAGSWDGLTLGFYDEGSRLEGLTVEYAGGTPQGAIYCYYSDVEIVGCTVTDSGSDGLYAQSATVRIQGSTFENNTDDGIYLDASSTIDHSAGPSFTGNLLTGNGGHPITLHPESVGQLDATSSFAGNGLDTINVLGGSVSTSGTWQDQDVPYLLSDMVYVQGASPYPHLTIDDGTTLVAGGGGGIYVGYTGYGSLTAAGTAGAGITFTSASGTPAAGDWEGLTLGFYCEPASTSLSNVTVEYGGANGMGNVFFYYCDGTLTDSTIQHSSEWGIYRQSCTPTLSGITYASNAAGDLF